MTHRQFDGNFESQSQQNVEIVLQARSLKAKLAPLVEVIVAVGTCLVLGYGARLALAGQLSAGVLIVFLLYLGRMYKPMRELSKMTDTVSKAMVGYERIQEVLEIESRVRDHPHARLAAGDKDRRRIQLAVTLVGQADDAGVHIKEGHEVEDNGGVDQRLIGAANALIELEEQQHGRRQSRLDEDGNVRRAPAWVDLAECGGQVVIDAGDEWDARDAGDS